MKFRINCLSSEYRLKTSTVMQALQELGIEARSQLASIEEHEACLLIHGLHAAELIPAPELPASVKKRYAASVVRSIHQPVINDSSISPLRTAPAVAVIQIGEAARKLGISAVVLLHRLQATGTLASSHLSKVTIDDIERALCLPIELMSLEDAQHLALELRSLSSASERPGESQAPGKLTASSIQLDKPMEPATSRVQERVASLKSAGRWGSAVIIEYEQMGKNTMSIGVPSQEYLQKIDLEDLLGAIHKANKISKEGRNYELKNFLQSVLIIAFPDEFDVVEDGHSLGLLVRGKKAAHITIGGLLPDARMVIKSRYPKT